MKHSHILQTLSTKYFTISALSILLIVICGLACTLWFDFFKLDQATKFIDVILKATALSVGALWALNRYYVHRTDFEQIRVDSAIDIVKYKESIVSKSHLLIYRLDVINTGKTLIVGHGVVVRVDTIEPGTDGPSFNLIYQWPETGKHHFTSIEPGSWTAIDDTICFDPNLKAIRISLELTFENGQFWTWHKSFSLT